MQYLLTCRRQTYAQRGARVLERAGITGTVARAPKSISKNGCAYCVTVSEKNKERAIATLTRAGIPPERVYCRDKDGSIWEVGL